MCRCVHSGLRGFTWARLGFVGFNRFRVGSIGRALCLRVHSAGVGSLGRAHGPSASLVFVLVHSGANSGRRLHSSSRGFSQAHLGFIRVRVGSLRRT